MAKTKKSESKRLDPKSKWAGGTQRASRGNFDYPKMKTDKKRNYFVLFEDDFGECYQHWAKKPKEGGEDIRSFNCAGGIEGVGDAPDQCACCALESGDLDVTTNAYVDNTRHRYFLKVVPVKFIKKGGKSLARAAEKEVQILEIGPQIFKGLSGIRSEIDDDEAGEYADLGISSVTGVVIQVTKVGEGRNTEYSVKALQSKVDTVKILKGCEDECPPLEELSKADSNSRMRVFLLGADSMDEDDDDEVDLDAGDEDEDEDDDDEVDLDDDEDDDEDDDDE